MEFEAGSLLSQTVQLLRHNYWRVAIALIVMAGSGMLMDLAWGDGNGANLVYNIVALFFELWLTMALLTDLGRRAAGAGGFGALFAVSLLSQLGVLLGLVLLIIPGVVLAVRWSICVPLVLSERMSAIEALKQSWRETDGHFWPIFAVLLLIYVPLMAGAMAFVGLTAETAPVAGIVLLNLAITVVLIVGWHAAVAMFLTAKTNERALEEVFA